MDFEQSKNCIGFNILCAFFPIPFRKLGRFSRSRISRFTIFYHTRVCKGYMSTFRRYGHVCVEITDQVVFVVRFCHCKLNLILRWNNVLSLSRFFYRWRDTSFIICFCQQSTRTA